MMTGHSRRALTLLEWVILAAALISDALTPGMHGSAAAMMTGTATIVVFGALGFIDTSVARSIFVVLARSALLAVIALVCGRETYLFVSFALIVSAGARFPLPVALGVAVFAWALPLIPPLRTHVVPLNVSDALLMAVVTAFVVLALHTLRRLSIANARLQQFAKRLEANAILAERNRIASELHDAVGHELTTLNVALETALALRTDDPAKAHEFLSQAKGLASQSLAAVRRTVSLMAEPLEVEPLDELLRSLADEASRMTGIDVRCEAEVARCRPEVTTALYRIAQEAITNAVRYARSTRIDVVARCRDGRLLLEVRDEGDGFVPGANRNGQGLRIMRDRAESLGGNFELQTLPARGCLVRATVPITP